MKQWWNMLNQDKSAMKQFVSWSWNTVKHVESGWISNETIFFMVVKHRETCWIMMKHGHETPWIRMKQCFMDMKHCFIIRIHEWTLNQDETVCLMVMKHTVSCQWNTFNQGWWPQRYLFSYIDFWFIVFHGVSLCCFMLFHCCFIAVSLLFHAVSLLCHAVSCCFKVFQGVSLLCFILFHGVSSLYLMVFQGVSLPCFILFHDHETVAVGTSLHCWRGKKYWWACDDA